MAQLQNLLVTGVSRLLSKLYVNDSVTAPTFIGKLQGNADTATNATKVNNHTVNSDVPSGAKFTDTVYSHPTSSGNKHIPSGGSSGQILRWSADGTAAWGSDNNTTYSDATQSAHGLMSVDDKKKLDGIATGANKYSHPTYTAKSSGLYKVTVDSTGHVSAATAVTKADITGLGIPGSDTNTDTKVTQTAVTESSYTNWRSLVWGASNSATEGFAPTTVTDGLFSSTGLSVQPSSGTIRATTFKGKLNGNADTATNATKVNNHTVNSDVPSGAKFTDTNTWRGVQNNLTSTATDQSLSAYQGKVLSDKISNKVLAQSSEPSTQATGDIWLKTTDL